MEFLNDGIWKASTEGMKSIIINPHDERIISMEDMVYALLDYITPSLKHFGNEEAISVINKIINGKTEGEKQVDVYNEFGFDGLKRFLVEDVEYNYN